MYEFTIINKVTKEEEFIFGHNSTAAFRKRGYNPDEWSVIDVNYAD